eukprot:5442762-Lingulodinium_polyedra.AAC.1
MFAIEPGHLLLLLHWGLLRVLMLRLSLPELLGVLEGALDERGLVREDLGKPQLPAPQGDGLAPEDQFHASMGLPRASHQ